MEKYKGLDVPEPGEVQNVPEFFKQYTDSLLPLIDAVSAAQTPTLSPFVLINC